MLPSQEYRHVSIHGRQMKGLEMITHTLTNTKKAAPAVKKPNSNVIGSSESAHDVVTNTNGVVSSCPVDGITEKVPGIGGPLVIAAIDVVDLLPLVMQLREKTSVVLSGSVFGPSNKLEVTVDKESLSTADAVSNTSGEVKATAVRTIEGSLIDQAHTPDPEKDTDADSRKLAFTLILVEITVLATINGAVELSTTSETSAAAGRE